MRSAFSKVIFGVPAVLLVFSLSIFNSGCNQPAPGFVLTLEQEQLYSWPGGSEEFTLTVTPQNGFTGTVSLALAARGGGAAPAGLSISPTSLDVSGSSPVGANVTLSVDGGMAEGEYDLDIVASSGNLSKSAALGLVVGPVPGSVWSWRSGGVFESVAYGNGVYVIVGSDGAIVTSPDGASWTARGSGTDAWLYSVTYGNGTFVAVGDGGTILTSADGESWTAQTSGTSTLLYGVTFGNNTFVAVGKSGRTVTSTNGVDWTPRTSGTSDLTSVAYGNGTFVAVG
ncbi:WD40/YVTN/BNR-like repeat-containing protein, partial [Oceanithermus sp.]